MVKNLQQKYQKCPEIWFGFSVWHPSKEKLDTWKPIGKKWCPTSGIFLSFWGPLYICNCLEIHPIQAGQPLVTGCPEPT